MGLFGKRGSSEKTVAILDIENGSVGGALTQISRDHQPRVFGETRQLLPLHPSPSAERLRQDIEQELDTVLLHLGKIASHLRQHETTHIIGEVERVAVFLHAPWAHLTVGEGGKVTTHSQPEFLDTLRGISQTTFDGIPLSFHAFGGAVAPLVHSLFDEGDTSLVSSISGEVTELILVNNGAIVAQGSIPVGTHTLLRTLKTHTGSSTEEARSALKLLHSHTIEPLTFAQEKFIEDFKDVASELLEHASTDQIFVVGEEGVSNWFAKALAHESLGQLFEGGGSVRAVPMRLLSSHVAIQGRSADVPLLLATLFIDSHISGIR